MNLQSRYIKIDAYLLILCHVISDVKLSHCFHLSKIKNVFLTLKPFRKQYQNIKQKRSLLECRKTSTVKYTSKLSLFLVFICVFWSLNCNMNGLRHKYFSVEVMFLFCHKVKAANDIWSVVKNNWNWNFPDFIELQEKKTGFADLPNLTKAAGFITCNYI